MADMKLPKHELVKRKPQKMEKHQMLATKKMQTVMKETTGAKAETVAQDFRIA